MKVVDRNRHPFRQGIYTDGNINSPESSQFYEVFKTEEGWRARGVNGKVYIIDYPEGLPDSSIMPKGKIDAAELTYVKRSELGFAIHRLATLSRETSKKRSFLEQLVQPTREPRSLLAGSKMTANSQSRSRHGSYPPPQHSEFT